MAEIGLLGMPLNITFFSWNVLQMLELAFDPEMITTKLKFGLDVPNTVIRNYRKKSPRTAGGKRPKFIIFLAKISQF